VIVIDANLLIYAYNSGAEQFESARRWLEAAFGGPEPVRLPWAVIHAFLRITTATKIMPYPLTITDAIAVVDEWLAAPNVSVLEPGPRYWRIFRDVLIGVQIRGPHVTDAHLAALVIEHGATFYTVDRGFHRFDGVRVVNPLV
jgi:toxin-antitoxin system PIN domain toxin